MRRSSGVWALWPSGTLRKTPIPACSSYGNFQSCWPSHWRHALAFTSTRKRRNTSLFAVCKARAFYPRKSGKFSIRFVSTETRPTMPCRETMRRRCPRSNSVGSCVCGFTGRSRMPPINLAPLCHHKRRLTRAVNCALSWPSYGKRLPIFRRSKSTSTTRSAWPVLTQKIRVLRWPVGSISWAR